MLRVAVETCGYLVTVPISYHMTSKIDFACSVQIDTVGSCATSGKPMDVPLLPINQACSAGGHCGEAK